MEYLPHQFAKDGREYDLPSGAKARPLICIHCDKRYVANLEPKPSEPCHARPLNKEIKRLKGQMEEPPRLSYNEVKEANPELDDAEILKLFEDSIKALRRYLGKQT